MSNLKLITNQAIVSLTNVHDEECMLVQNSSVSTCREGLGIFINATFKGGTVVQIILTHNDAATLCAALEEILQSRETIQ